MSQDRQVAERHCRYSRQTSICLPLGACLRHAAACRALGRVLRSAKHLPRWGFGVALALLLLTPLPAQRLVSQPHPATKSESLDLPSRRALRRLPTVARIARMSRHSAPPALLASDDSASAPVSESLLGGDADLLGGDDIAGGHQPAPPSLVDAVRRDSPPDRSTDEPGDEVDRRANKHDDPPCVDPHYELFAREMYPSAKECGKCHEKIYREWSVSGHAYATVSPMFQKFEQRISELVQGTIGYFCMRCHAPVATDMEVPRDANIWETIPAAREGVTCIACHRVLENYGRVNGERRIETGSLFAPVVAGGNGAHVHEVIRRKDYYKIKTSPDDLGPGQPIHTDVVQFHQISTSHFCVSCHQVAVYPGIKLEVVWEQYRASPACKAGIRCQDCHMGAVPGRPSGFETAPAAVVGGKPVNPDRRHSNHMFVGPGYSIAHPGVFPFNEDADRWSHQQWMQFDWRADWGTEEFEDHVGDDAVFPEAWQNVDDRYDARDVIAANQELLAEKTKQRFLLMEGNSTVQGPFFSRRPRVGQPLHFHYQIRNLNSGHNMPSGSLGAQPQLWLNVALTGPGGERLWESGYVDANGDMADLHSLEVAAGRIHPDQQLVNLQTKFLITGAKGTDREMYLPINVDIDQLPFIRPSGFPITTMNHPPFIRMEAHSLTPLGKRKARYHIPRRVLSRPGRYKLTVRMRSRAEPIYFMRYCYATPEMERAMNERMLDFHQHAFEFVVR